jgi:hypothetical protein
MNLDDYFGTTSRKTSLANKAIADRATEYGTQQATSNPLEAIFNSLVINPGKAVVDFFGRETARVGNLLQGKSSKQADEEAQKFSNMIYGTNNAKDAAAKRLGSALDLAAAGTNVVAPGLAGALAGGALRGAGSEFTTEGANADIGRAFGKGLVGAASEGLSAGALKGVGKLASGSGVGSRALGKLTNPSTIMGNIGRGAISGATEGAFQGAGNTLVSGGTLEQALGGAAQGFGSGGLMGGLGGGVMGTASKGIRSIGNRLNGRPPQIEEPITAEAPRMNSKQIAAQKKAVKQITDQFGVVPKKVNDMVKPNETFTSVARDFGLTDEGDIRVGMRDMLDVGSKIVRDTAGPTGIIDIADARSLVRNLPKAQAQKVGDLMDYIIESSESSIVGGKSGMDALQLQRAMESVASNIYRKGEVSMNGSPLDTMTADNIYKAARLIGDNLDKAVVNSRSMGAALDANAGAIEALRNRFPNNKKWQAQIDKMINSVDSETPLLNLRSSIKVPTRATIFMDAADENMTTFGGRNSDLNIPTTRSGLTGAIVDQTAGRVARSKPVRNAQINRNLSKAFGGTATPKPRTSAQIPIPIENMARNAIGTNEGVRGADIVRASDNAQIDQDISQILQQYLLNGGNMQNINAPQQMSPQSAQNIMQLAGTQSMGQNPPLPQNTLESALSGSQAGFKQELLNNIIGAMQFGDDKAMNRYISLYEILNEQNKPATQQKLTDTQRKANSAMTQLEQLSAMSPDTGSFVADIPVIGGLVDLFGGNEYNSQATSLASQLGYMQSGANVTPQEVERIRRAYLPTATDSPAVAQRKLANARAIIQNYQQSYIDPTLESALY